LRAPDSDIWVNIYDLPEDTRKEFWRRLDAGYWPDDTMINPMQATVEIYKIASAPRAPAHDDLAAIKAIVQRFIDAGFLDPSLPPA
jgi:hypothetical protein